MADVLVYLVLIGIAALHSSTPSQWLSYRKIKLVVSRITWIFEAVAAKEIVEDFLVNI